MPRTRRKFRLPHPEPTDALTYARFTGVSTFMRLPHITDPEELEVALIGVPFDGGTTYRSGPRFGPRHVREQSAIIRPWNPVLQDRKSTRLNSSHGYISYAVFCLKKKNR